MMHLGGSEKVDWSGLSVKLVREKGAVTDGGGFRAEGWGWLTVQVGPMRRGPTLEGCSQVSSNPWERESLASWGTAGRTAGR